MVGKNMPHRGHMKTWGPEAVILGIIMTDK